MSLGTIGDVVLRDIGHAANLASNTISHGSLHGAGNAVGNFFVGTAHADPANPAVLLNTSTWGNSAPASSDPTKATKASTGTTDAAAPNNTSTLASNAQLGTGGGTSSNINAINSAYDTLSNYYKGLQGTIDPQKQIAQGQTDTQYSDNLNSLTHQRDAAFANLDNQTNVVNQSYQKSLAQLGNNIRNTMQGQQNALGVNGAGDSSASVMLAHALSQLQNQNRSYMNQDMNNQLNQIGLSRTADTNQFSDQKQQLDDWKTSQYQNIATQYAQLAQQINEKLAGNEQYRQLALANAGQWASGQAQQVDNTLKGSLDSLNQTYAQNQAPSVSMGNLPQYQATAINAPTVAASGDMNNTTSPQDVMQYVSPQSYKDQSQNQFSY